MRGKRGRGLRGLDSRPYLGLGRREEVGRRGPAAVGGGGRGGGAARPGRGAQELSGFVDERMRAEGVFIAKEWRWQGGGGEELRLWRSGGFGGAP